MSLPQGLHTSLLETFTEPTANASLRGILRGLEKESLRVTPAGTLAQTDHPHSLGSALTHPHITTDYSEALLEFITDPFDDVAPLLAQLDDIHRFTYQQLAANNERLWPASMPCILGGDDEIPVARYGSSNSGKMKTVYRIGLGHRYGRAMQTIAGIHYNFSMPDDFWRVLQTQCNNQQSLQDFKTERYFGLIRNFRRNFWLLIYLFGASPAVSSCFVKNRTHKLQLFPAAEHTMYLPFATSLRMGDLGYQSDAQKSLVVNYNNLGDYLKTLCGAITQSHPAYEQIGVKDNAGNYQQLNNSLLQIENEFYSSIRPKRTTGRGETALQALRLRGVEYVEVRCVDLNPYAPLGITAEQMQLMDAFLLYCLLSDSPETDEREFYQGQENQKRIVNNGRDPQLQLQRGDKDIPMPQWANEILRGCSACAALLDQAKGGNYYQQAVAAQFAKIDNAELTPSAQVLRDMQQSQQSFYAHVSTQAEQHRAYFAERPLIGEFFAAFTQMSETSLQSQKDLEASQQLSFDQYLENYYAQYRGCSCGT
ncbi:glutamate--cysteine ligase [Cellvibrio sp. pealriver]|uniref:glutamate--cysteine ligase n=1 Tax=Cellvibrio sp. pealriver TaxID=1622269 RepID=UPI0009E55C13|nr:glutamate--cysteine ligase [Cellvibrio sp. pealriver]